MKLKNLILPFGTAISLAAAPPAPSQKGGEPPPAASYTAETTYAKLVKTYPYIRIASREVPAEITAVRDIVYARRARRDLHMDLYLPKSGAGKAAAGIVFVHGGGWRVGVRENFAPMAIKMAQRGYAAATISYRLADEARYPAAVLDARAAVRWMRTHSARYGIDPGRIVLAGGSAGGQIASLAGLAGKQPGFDPAERHGGVSGDVQAIVNIDGLSDFEAEVRRLRSEPADRQPVSWSAWFGGWFRGPNDTLPALWREASPVRYAGPGSPPMLFIGSSVARFSIGREQMVERLRTAKVAAEVCVLPESPHSFWLFDPWLEPSVEVVADFLDRQLPSDRQDDAAGLAGRLGLRCPAK